MIISMIYQLVTMVLLMVVGFLLTKKNFLSESNTKGLSVVLTRVAVPANMIILMQRPYSYGVLMDFLKIGGGTILICFVGTFMFMVLGKFLGMEFPELGLFSGGGVYSNVIFMGLPLINSMYGEDGRIFCVAIMFASNVFLFTVCSFLFSHKCGPSKSIGRVFKEAFINLICLSAVIGFFCFLYSITLPEPISNALQYSANTTVCLSMIVIGSLLARAHLGKVLKDKTVYIFSFFTLIVMPIITKYILGLFIDGLALSVLVILMATPAAAALPSFAENYGNDGKRASEFVFVSTIFSVITLPIIARFLC